MKSLRSRCLVLWTVVALPLAGCSESGRYQLVAISNNMVYRIDTTTGETWKTSGAEWALVRTAPPKRR